VGTYRGAISTSKLLSGREIDCSGKGMFSSQDRAYVVGQYVPKYGPELVSHAFVAGFQVH
jgi:DDB1- and CUL4-associated factor 11